MRFGTLCVINIGAPIKQFISLVLLFTDREGDSRIKILVKIGKRHYFEHIMVNTEVLQSRMVFMILLAVPYRLLCLVNTGIGRRDSVSINRNKIYDSPKRLAPD